MDDVTVDQAGGFLAGECTFMETELGVDPELLDSRWAERMLRIKWPALTEDQASWLLQQVGWF